MRNYGQFGPIARASELLSERWSIIILRNILIGCRSFNEIADGAPGLSRGLLSKRLRELERAGVVEIHPKPDGPGSTYEPTQAGRELWDVMLALQHWGSKWAELAPEHAHPGVVLWSWVTGYLDRDRLPRRRLLIRFDYPTLLGRAAAAGCWSRGATPRSARNTQVARRTWSSWSTIPWRSLAGHLGQLEWGDALRSGAIELRGSRALPTWNRRVGPVQHQAAPTPAATPA